MQIDVLPLVEGLAEFINHEKVLGNKTLESMINNKLLKGIEPETSGGLLCVLESDKADEFAQELRDLGQKCYVIGELIESEERKVIYNNIKCI